MSTVGKFCLIVTLLLLLLAIAPIPSPYGGWTPRLLVIHNEWSERLRDAKAGVRQKAEAETAARLELLKAASELEALMVGWDRAYNLPRRGPNVPQGAPSVTFANGRLQLVNLNIPNSDDFDDGAGGRKTARPVVHAFFAGAEGGYSYFGEFVATGPNNNSLEPVHRVNPAELDSNPTWRLRTMVPGSFRSQIDALQQHLVRTAEMTVQTEANIVGQQVLLKGAEDQLTERRGELLGNPDPDREVKGRPEITEGLLKVTEDVEEERDQLLLDVDRLRRAIQGAGAVRDSLVESLKTALESLPGSSADYDQLTPQLIGGN